jgi:DNA-binding CsgD family transcriptional regulator
MSRSNRLTLREIRQVNTMIEQVGELGADPHIWRPHLMERTCLLLRARVAISMDCTNAAPDTIPRLIDPIDMGWEECDHRRLHQYFSSGEVSTDPSATSLFRAHERVRFLTVTRRALAGDREWYASPTVSEARHSANIDDFVCSSVALAPHVLQGSIYYRDWGDTPFSARDRRLLRYVHLCVLRRLRDSSLAHRLIAAEFDLSPRLHQTFQLLLGGDGVKTIADGLGVSLHTLNGYVKTVYRKLKVRSRLELIAIARKWHPRPFILPQALVAAMKAAQQPRAPMLQHDGGLPGGDPSDNGDDVARGG